MDVEDSVKECIERLEEERSPQYSMLKRDFDDLYAVLAGLQEQRTYILVEDVHRRLDGVEKREVGMELSALYHIGILERWNPDAQRGFAYRTDYDEDIMQGMYQYLCSDQTE